MGSNMSVSRFEDDSHLAPYRLEPQCRWAPYDDLADQYRLFASDPDFVALAANGVDIPTVIKNCQDLSKPASPTTSKGVRDNARQLQSARWHVNQWCQEAASAPSVKSLYDDWGSKYPHIALKAAVEQESKIKQIASTFGPLETRLEASVSSVTQISAEWSGQYGWYQVAISLAQKLAADPNDETSKKKFTDLFQSQLIPQLQAAVKTSTSAQSGAATFASNIGTALADAKSIDTTLNQLVTALEIVEKGDLEAYAALRKTENALKKAIPGLAVGGVAAAGVGAVVCEAPPPFDVIGVGMMIAGIVTEIAAIGSIIALAVIANKESHIYSQIQSEKAAIAQCTHSKRVYDNLTNNAGIIQGYANSFDQAINNLFADYNAVLKKAQGISPDGSWLVQKVHAIDAVWSEVHQDAETLKNLGIIGSKVTRLKTSQWVPTSTDTAQTYYHKILKLANS